MADSGLRIEIHRPLRKEQSVLIVEPSTRVAHGDTGKRHVGATYGTDTIGTHSQVQTVRIEEIPGDRRWYEIADTYRVEFWEQL
jgi:hypothetical protein